MTWLRYRWATAQVPLIPPFKGGLAQWWFAAHDFTEASARFSGYRTPKGSTMWHSSSWPISFGRIRRIWVWYWVEKRPQHVSKGTGVQSTQAWQMEVMKRNTSSEHPQHFGIPSTEQLLRPDVVLHLQHTFTSPRTTRTPRTLSRLAPPHRTAVSTPPKTHHLMASTWQKADQAVLAQHFITSASRRG